MKKIRKKKNEEPNVTQFTQLPPTSSYNTIAEFKPLPFSITFNDVNNQFEPIGQFYEKDGKLHFEGDVDESAQIFVNSVIHMMNTQYEPKS